MNYTKVNNCGCRVDADRYRNTIWLYCPKHKAAPDMYEALLTAFGTIKALDNGQKWIDKIYVVIQKALAKADGG